MFFQDETGSVTASADTPSRSVTPCRRRPGNTESAFHMEAVARTVEKVERSARKLRQAEAEKQRLQEEIDALKQAMENMREELERKEEGWEATRQGNSLKYERLMATIKDQSVRIENLLSQNEKFTQEKVNQC